MLLLEEAEAVTKVIMSGSSHSTVVSLRILHHGSKILALRAARLPGEGQEVAPARAWNIHAEHKPHHPDRLSQCWVSGRK